MISETLFWRGAMFVMICLFMWLVLSAKKELKRMNEKK